MDPPVAARLPDLGARMSLRRWPPAPPPRGHRQACSHEHRVPVELIRSGDVVAQLCLNCDAQLAPDWIPRMSWCPYGELPTFPPVHPLPPYVPEPGLTRRIQE